MQLKGNVKFRGAALIDAILRVESVTREPGGWRGTVKLYGSEDAANPPKEYRAERQLAAVQPTIGEGEEKIPDPVYEDVQIDATPAPEAMDSYPVTLAPFKAGADPFVLVRDAALADALARWPESVWVVD
jgi:hypothetical protein